MRRLGTRRAVIALCALTIVILVVLVGGYVLFAGVHTTPDGTYVESPSSIRTSLHANVTSGQMTLRVNKVADAATREMHDTWERAALERKSGLYNHTLVPPAGEKYLLANITVTNAAQHAVPFTYTNMYLVGRDGSTYYANYAAGTTPDSAQLVKNHTLKSGETNTVYVLFAVPSQAQASKLVYASRPPVVVSLT